MKPPRLTGSNAGALALVVLAATYLVASLVSGHSAASHPPADLSASAAGVGVHPAVALLVDHPGSVAILDTRAPGQYEAYHLPGAVHVVNPGPRQLLRAMGDHPVALVVGSSDEQAAALVTATAELDSGRQLHFLQGGAQAFYLTYELPVAAFSDQTPPFGYEAALATVRDFLRSGHTDRPERVREALGKLSSLEFAPNQLAGKKPKATKKRKKISGGCG